MRKAAIAIAVAAACIVGAPTAAAAPIHIDPSIEGAGKIETLAPDPPYTCESAEPSDGLGWDCAEETFEPEVLAITLVATPPAEWEFDGWAEGTCPAPDDNRCTITASVGEPPDPPAPAAPVAVFKPEPTVVVDPLPPVTDPPADTPAGNPPVPQPPFPKLLIPRVLGPSAVKARVSRTQTFRLGAVRVTCPAVGIRCRILVTLKGRLGKRAIPIAVKSFRLRPSSESTVKLRLTRKAALALKAKRRLKAVASITVTAPDVATQKSVSVTLRPARR